MKENKKVINNEDLEDEIPVESLTISSEMLQLILDIDEGRQLFTELMFWCNDISKFIDRDNIARESSHIIQSLELSQLDNLRLEILNYHSD